MRTYSDGQITCYTDPSLSLSLSLSLDTRVLRLYQYRAIITLRRHRRRVFRDYILQSAFALISEDASVNSQSATESRRRCRRRRGAETANGTTRAATSLGGHPSVGSLTFLPEFPRRK